VYRAHPLALRFPRARAAAYVRISRDREGEALGVARQEQDSRALAESRGWQVVAVYADNDITASGKAVRPGWRALLDAMDQGDVDAVVAYSSSRLYRNLRDLSAFLDAVERRSIQVATVVSGDVRVDTADGRMMARILASIDQGEWERARERYMRKRQELIADGKWTGGWVGFGYRVGGEGRLEVDPGQGAAIKDAATRLLNGESQGSILRRWAEDGVRTPRGAAWRGASRPSPT